MTTACPHCGKPIELTKPEEPARPEAICWRAPNAHPPHIWYEDNDATREPVWCPGVKGTTMY